MKTRIVQIGNSRGVRLPKLAIEEAGLSDEVELRVRPGAIIIESAASPRAGWAQAAQKMRERGDDKLVLGDGRNRFDAKDWKW